MRCAALALGLAAGAPGAASQALPPGARVDTVATGLEVPWGIGFAGDGRVFLSERAGRIRVMENGALRPEPWATLPVAGAADSGAGLLGLALDPEFAASRHLYVMGSFRSADGALENRLYRLTDSAGVAGAPELVLGGLPSARAHAGSAVAFGPDGFLYVTLGDAFDPESAQDPARPGGKILRLDRDGTVPRDNPTPGSAVYARGLRNVQGLAWDSVGHILFATEHGPSSWPWERGRSDHDELNVIRAGGNYGWPVVMGAARHGRFLDPMLEWTPAIAPSGIASYHGPYQPWRGSLLVGALKGQELRRIVIDRGASGPRVVREEAVFPTGRFGRIRGVFVAPDGSIWFTTSQRKDPEGRPDDRIYRLTLPRSD